MLQGTCTENKLAAFINLFSTLGLHGLEITHKWESKGILEEQFIKCLVSLQSLKLILLLSNLHCTVLAQAASLFASVTNL